ncbi:MAG: tRNA (N6-threonylcarbamoyladenosine(37)-N6)-methyltransferase TrmO [Promethearchaeia archaeon]
MPKKENYTIRPVGSVESEIKEVTLKAKKRDIALDRENSNHQDPYFLESKIIIKEEYLDCLDGIEGFSHMKILFWTHKTTEENRLIRKVHPGGMKECPKKGIFATRSPVRPNPICETTVKLLKRKGNTLIVQGFDAIDGTPVLDIKPYLPNYDYIEDTQLPEWIIKLSEYFRQKNKRNKH